MAKEKAQKTNAMRILDRMKIPYEVLSYPCEEFIDGLHTADRLGIPYEYCFKTLVLQGKSRQYYVFVLPIAEELDLKECARIVNEKSVEMIPVKEINAVTGYIRGCCTALGMKKQYPVVLHKSAGELAYMYVSAGKLGEQLRLSPGDFCRACGARIDNIIAERNGH